MSASGTRLASRTAILLVCGLVAFATGAIVVHAATSAQVAKKKKKPPAWPSFLIRAEIAQGLAPGKNVPIKISVANNRLKPIWITRLAVRLAVDDKHARAGCKVSRDYHVVQLPKSVFPFKVVSYYRATKKSPAKLRWRTLRDSRTRGRPILMMHNLPSVNQNACKGATLKLTFASKSTLKKPKGKKAWKASVLP
ncbi:MAG: hypothetical protein JHD02_01025 [Thermoleophilaceae bacterium]|nr:hypothetical protein [Thermoleophilaceae bacterium]